MSIKYKKIFELYAYGTTHNNYPVEVYAKLIIIILFTNNQFFSCLILYRYLVTFLFKFRTINILLMKPIMA